MASLSRRPWQIWSSALSTLGAAGFIVVFLCLFGLIGYYSSKRPREPMPEKGWTEPLRWTHGYYGTHAENEQLLRLFDWQLPFFLLGAVGAWIKMLHKKNEPWRAK